MSDFKGFSKDTFAYLRDLAEHNEREWFTANRARYEAHYLEPALAFIETLGPRLIAEVSDEVRYDARVNGSLLRINRDVRFSPDKRPYKDHLDIWFWQGETKGWDTPGYYLRLEPQQWTVAAGMHHLPKETLDAFRTAVIDPGEGAALDAAIAELDGSGLELGGASRKSVPRGYDANHPRAAYLLHEGLFVLHYTPDLAEAQTPGFADTCLRYFKAARPLNDWLVKALRPGRR
ncbi:MAG TPA: DUF2461 domain-containing protein [Dehalococcoidia bacterium]|jgi:uncharacterized protein (TIGR02453 family)|nr:DUF2461 domain-containing protein [Dehalococcoidia bacterium]